MKLIEMQNHFYAKGFKPLRITACGGGCGNQWAQPARWAKSGSNTGKTLPDVLKYVYKKVKKPKDPPVPPLWPYEEKRKRSHSGGGISATNSYTIVACGCGGWPHGCGGGCGNLFASPYMYMPRIVACGGYGGCGSSLNPGWEEIGGGCGRTYYRYTGCGSPGCGGPLPSSCG